MAPSTSSAARAPVFTGRELPNSHNPTPCTFRLPAYRGVIFRRDGNTYHGVAFTEIPFAAMIAASLSAALVRREVGRLLHRQGPRRAGTGLRLFRAGAARGGSPMTRPDASPPNVQRPAPARRGAFGGEALSAKLTGGGETR